MRQNCAIVAGARRFSQAISEGEGISLIVEVGDLDGVRAAEAEGADGIVLVAPLAGARDGTGLPILWRSDDLTGAAQAGADACVLVLEDLADDDQQLERHYAAAVELGLDCVVEVRDEAQLEQALDRVDPEIFLLSGRDHAHREDGLDVVLDLLPDVPAGKLAVAEVPVATRDEVAALERAGIDAVIVRGRGFAELVSAPPPEV